MHTFEPDRSNWGFLLGFHDYSMGHSECPFAAGTEAERQWHAGQQDAADDACRAEAQFAAQFEANYCEF